MNSVRTAAVRWDGPVAVTGVVRQGFAASLHHAHRANSAAVVKSVVAAARNAGSFTAHPSTVVFIRR